MFNRLNSSDKKIKIHFVGIGGIGVSGIAEILLHLNYTVSGSDIVENQNTQKLKKLGGEIKIGHCEENVFGANVVVYSSAVDLQRNPEILSAKRHNIPLLKRGEMLAELMRLKYGIAVAGTHGKTTTTSFLATILYESGMDSTHIIGGIVGNLGGHARVGQGELLVAEADESDGSFLLLGPIISIITNIDDDHLDFYKSKKNLIRSFLDFANRVPFYGCCILNIHDEEILKIKSKIKRPCVTFGILDSEDRSEDILGDILLEGRDDLKTKIVNYQARDVKYQDSKVTYNLYFNNDFSSEIMLSIPGRHNVLNSLGAIATAHQLGISFQAIASSIGKFKGVGRRLELLYKKQNVEIIDDYAHHPTEVINVINTVRRMRPESQLIAIFEPHRYSRTLCCWDKFLHCFNSVDKLFILPIYAASEKMIDGITSSRLVSDINHVHPKMAQYVPKFEDIEENILQFMNARKIGSTKSTGDVGCTDNDNEIVILTLGAGSIGKNIREFLARYETHMNE